MINKGDIIEAEVRGEYYYIAKCYTFDLNYHLRKLDKDELKNNLEDKNIITTYCVLTKDKYGNFRVADNCNMSNNSIEQAIQDFLKHIYEMPFDI